MHYLKMMCLWRQSRISSRQPCTQLMLGAEDSAGFFWKDNDERHSWNIQLKLQVFKLFHFWGYMQTKLQVLRLFHFWGLRRRADNAVGKVNMIQLIVNLLFKVVARTLFCQRILKREVNCLDCRCIQQQPRIQVFLGSRDLWNVLGEICLRFV